MSFKAIGPEFGGSETGSFSAQQIQMQQIYTRVQQADWVGAAQVVQALLQTAPDHPWTLFAQGYLAESQQDLGVAATFYEACLQREPRFWEACFHLSYCYWEQERAIDSVQILERALALQPQHFRIWQSLLPRIFEMGENQMLQQTLDALLGPVGQRLAGQFSAQHLVEFEAWQPILRSWRSHLAFGNPDLSNSDFHRSFSEQTLLDSPAGSERLWSHAHLRSDPDRVLKVAWFSNEWSYPAIGHGYLPLLQAATSQFEHSAWIDNQEADGIDLLDQGFAKQINVFNKDNTQLGQTLQLEQIDLIFDLSGWFNPIRLALWAQKPVPVICSGGTNPPFQIKIPGVDLVFSDRLLWPQPIAEPDSRVYLSSFFRWQAPENPPNRNRLAGAQALVLGSAASLNKINDLTLRLWTDLMNILPEATFHLKNKWFVDPLMQKRWLNKWQSAGGNPSQLRLIDNQQQAELISFFATLDLALDSYPYAGALSSCDALWAGTPVLALAGGRQIADSIHHSLKIPELLARDQAQFLEWGQSLSRNPERLQAYRQSLPQKLLNSAICDYQGSMQTIEASWRAAWKMQDQSAGFTD